MIQPADIQMPPVATFDLTDITVLRYPAWYAADALCDWSTDTAANAKPVITNERPDMQAWESYKKGLHLKVTYAMLTVISRQFNRTNAQYAGFSIRRSS